MSSDARLPRLFRTALAALAFTALALSALAAPAAIAAQATPTSILVRVTSHDAKIIGSGVGGVRVVIRNADDGEILASGIQEGGTGNTQSIMVDPRVRGGTVFDTEGAAGFVATLELERPTMIEIAVEGPLDSPGATQRATKTMLVVPGKDVLGEGVVIELQGLTVGLESPAEGTTIVAGEPFAVIATVTMLCGCPTEPGGLWNADDMEIVAVVLRGGDTVAEGPLSFSGQRSTYEAEMTVHQSGRVELLVVATNSRTGNSGMGSLVLGISPAP